MSNPPEEPQSPPIRKLSGDSPDMLFSELYKIMVNKVAIVGFSWGDHHNRIPWTPP